MTDPKMPTAEITPRATPGTRPVAVIDIGASAIRMRIAEIGPNGEVHNLDSLQQALRLGKDTLRAQQLSVRGGRMQCTISGDRVKIAGRARLYLQGTLEL